MKIGLGRNLIVDIGRATVLFFEAYLVYQGQMSVGTLIFAFTLSEKSYASIYRLSRFYDRMEEGREGVSRLLLLFNAESEVKNVKDALVPKSIKGSIEFKQASFKYKNTRAIALNNVSFKIKAGQTVALVGPSGGGKTTIARLIYRHYDPNFGKVLVDGHDVSKLDLFAYRRFLAIVPQEVEIFDLSVRENIAYANPRASNK